MKRMRRSAQMGFGVLLLMTLSVPFARADSKELIEKAKEKDLQRFQFVIQNGGKIVPTADQKSFFAVWKPSGVKPEKFLVSLHGHDSWAIDDFSAWYPLLSDRKLAFIAIQWWFGGGEEMSDYYDPKSLYQQIVSELQNEGAVAGQVILHGFSRGSANSYSVVYEDRKSGNNFFSYVISNAGGMMSNYPPNRMMLRDPNVGAIYSGIEWVFFCGGRDPNPERDGCAAMHEASKWVVSHGAKELLFIEDANASHGGFHRNPANAEKALNAIGV